MKRIKCWIKAKWYIFSCWGWKRYSTVKPYKLDHSWINRVDLLPHVIMQVLVDFVENEMIPQNHHIPQPIGDYPDMKEYWEQHNKDTAELLSIYNWWKEWREDMDYEEWEAKGMPEYPSPDNLVDLHKKHYEELDNKCKRVIELRHYMWT